MLFSKILSERVIVVQVNTGKNGMSKTLHKLQFICCLAQNMTNLKECLELLIAFSLSDTYTDFTYT